MRVRHRLHPNRNGTIDEDVCLDFSSFSFADVPEGPATVTETTAPEGTRFGTVRVTPPELSDDAAIGLVPNRLASDDTDRPGYLSISLSAGVMPTLDSALAAYVL